MRLRETILQSYLGENLRRLFGFLRRDYPTVIMFAMGIGLWIAIFFRLFSLPTYSDEYKRITTIEPVEPPISHRRGGPPGGAASGGPVGMPGGFGLEY